MVGIKETKEALVGVNEVAVFLVHRFKDGIGTDDAIALWDKIRNDEEFKEKITTAYEGWQAIPGEIADLDWAEMLELTKCQLDYLPKYIDAFKG